MSWNELANRTLLFTSKNRTWKKKLIEKYGGEKFTDEEIDIIESDYDKITKIVKQQNAEISSSYWRKDV